MANFSFDIVSDYDLGELNNSVDQADREISNRYDLKGGKAGIEWTDNSKNSIKIFGENEFQLDSVLDIFRKKLVSRGQSQKLLDLSNEPTTSNMIVTRIVGLKKGLDQEKAKKVTSLIRDNYPKVKTQIQGDLVRATAAKKDDLQAVIQLLSTQDFDFPLDFINYR